MSESSAADRHPGESFSQRCAAARVHLLGEMERLGMRERDGWRIAESTRNVTGGSELVMRPIHRVLPTPDGVECVVRIEESGVTDSHCEP